jgi:hypothetical protein
MWELAYGRVPPGMFVLHRCDRPLCVKPGHLYLGTALENTRDMLAKGRAGGNLPPGGKLNEQSVTEIRRIWAAGGVTMKELGARFGVSGPMVWLVVHGKCWRWV